MFHTRSLVLSAAAVLPLMLAPRTSSAQLQNVPSIVRRSVTYERTGENAQETFLSPTTVASGALHKLFTISMLGQGQTYAQVLYVPNVAFASAPAFGTAVNANVLFVATTSNWVAAIDADNGRVYWQNQYAGLGFAPATPITNDNVPSTSCSNYKGTIGIVGTPVIYNSKIYFVTRNLTPGCGPVPGAADHQDCTTYWLHAVDILTGADINGSPVAIDGTVFTNGTGDGGSSILFKPDFENQRAALLDANGAIYIAFASYCDHNPYHGWLLEYDATTLTPNRIFASTPNGSEGGIWQSGGGPARDLNGHIYITVGNGSYDGTSNFGESVVEFLPPSWFASPPPPAFTPYAHYTPSNFSALNSGDRDFGTSGPLLTTTSPSNLVQVGKDGMLYNLGSLPGLATVQQPFSAIATGANGGNPGYNVGAFAQDTYFFWGSNDFIRAYPVVDSMGTLSSISGVSGNVRANGSEPGGALSISSNNSLSSAVVWATNQTPGSSGDPNNATVQGTLYAYSGANLGPPLWTSDQSAGDALGNLAKFNPPTVVNGKVYAASFAGPYDTTVSVYGLSPTFWGQNYGFGPGLGPPFQDWDYGFYKGQCQFGQPLTGLSAFASGLEQAHDVLCSGWVAAQNVNQLELFDSSLPASSWDWDVGYYKAECPDGYYVQGVAQSTSGVMHSILCTSNGTLAVLQGTCQVESFGNGNGNATNSTDYFGPDWDIGYYKGQCSPGYVVAGISANASTGPAGAPHAILCCPP